MLLVIHPVTYILGTITVQVDAMSIGLIVRPVSFVDVTIRVHKFPPTADDIVLPLTFVPRAVSIDLDSNTIPFAFEPLTTVGVLTHFDCSKALSVMQRLRRLRLIHHFQVLDCLLWV